MLEGAGVQMLMRGNSGAAADLPPASQGRVPGELMEVFAEKMLQACHALLGVVAELKRNALLNDVAGRNAEVRMGCGGPDGPPAADSSPAAHFTPPGGEQQQ